ncbi:MAG: hypothetical protein RBS40_03140 [Rhodocyclaceae bacterium]|jgi:hypothetical protein|nr:hypothetical protein [Rhodocyclaceae bacterium]
MTPRLILLACAGLLALPALGAEDGLAATIDALGQANGQALACRQPDAVSRIKRLMIERVPRTRDNGARFEAATQSAFLAQGQAAPCPDDATLTTRINALEARLPAPGSGS